MRKREATQIFEEKSIPHRRRSWAGNMLVPEEPREASVPGEGKVKESRASSGRLREGGSSGGTGEGLHMGSIRELGGIYLWLGKRTKLRRLEQ